ncbi:MAG: hypothetical protein V1820_06800 [archaeon]
MLASKVAGYLEEKYRIPDFSGIRTYNQSEMFLNPDFRELVAETEEIVTPVCKRKHEAKQYSGLSGRELAAKGRLKYECQTCYSEGTDPENSFDLLGGIGKFEIPGGHPKLMFFRDKHLAPGIHLIGRDWDDWRSDFQRLLAGYDVLLLFAPEILGTDGHKMSKSERNGSDPLQLSAERTYDLCRLLEEEPKEIPYSTWKNFAPVRD